MPHAALGTWRPGASLSGGGAAATIKGAPPNGSSHGRAPAIPPY